MAAYLPDDSGRHVPFGLMVLTLAGGSIMTITGSPSPRCSRPSACPRVSDGMVHHRCPTLTGHSTMSHHLKVLADPGILDGSDKMILIGGGSLVEAI